MIDYFPIRSDMNVTNHSIPDTITSKNTAKNIPMIIHTMNTFITISAPYTVRNPDVIAISFARIIPNDNITTILIIPLFARFEPMKVAYSSIFECILLPIVDICLS